VSTTVTPVDELPSGTVTLLFADVEGSTRLLNLLGERFPAARARMRELVREAAREHGGSEVDWAGDGAFLAFPRAKDAVAAAAQLHRSLATEPWPDEEAHRLRIGLHTGEPELGPEGYVGIDVVVASRICGAAHGEQVVVSQATRDVSGDTPIADGSYRPLGRHRLKDVPNAVQLFQLVGPSLRQEFPPLKTLSATSLPALHHRLVGRDAALARVETLIDSQSRLVTITGPGGAGKSRLALEVAGRAALDRPVHLVGLAPITDVELVPGAIARAIGARESGAHPVLDAVGDRLEGTGALLFLDNLEHLPGASEQVAALLDRAPDLQILATSRRPLRLTTEHVFPLEPLSIEDAATLFVELASARGVVLQPEALASVHEICRRLDGLPLAIELVAARLVVLPPNEIVRALEEGLALEMEGPVDLPERQRTLRAAIDWSYGRLTEDQRLLHGTLAVFSDGASLEDARALAPEPASFLADLEAIVGWSLVRSEASDGAVRLSMLETVREHALSHLEAEGALGSTRGAHAARFRDLALAAEDALRGEEQGVWLNRLESEFANLATTLDWLLSTGQTEDALRMLSGLERFWRGHAHVAEARRWLGAALAGSGHVSAEVRARALWTAARQATAQSDWSAAVPLLEEALAQFRDLGHTRDEVFALSELGFVALRLNDPERATHLCTQALELARRLGDVRAISGALAILSDVAREQRDDQRALALSEEALALRRSLGDSYLILDSTYHVGVSAFAAGDLERSMRAFEDTLVLAEGDALYTGAALCMLGAIDLLEGRLASAYERLDRSLAIYTDLADERSMAECVWALGGLAAALGDSEAGARLWGAADALREPAALEYAEPEIQERFGPLLVRDLGWERFAELRRDGSAARYDEIVDRVGMLVASGREE
jgi:predicted ATPase/class 3 adenylate cyclase